jgi:hypothetical protein
MDETRWERWGAASGFAAALFGAAATVFERGPLMATDAAPAVVNHLTSNRNPMLAQSMLFLAGAALYLWYLGSLRTFLARAEGGTGRLSAVTFGAGITWVGITMVAQAFQVGLAANPQAGAPAALIGTMNAVFTVGALPLTIMMAAIAVVSLRYRAFPAWLGWLAAVAAGSQFLLWLGPVTSAGPLAPNGWLSYALYPVFLIWLLPATVIMIRRAGGHTGVRLEPVVFWPAGSASDLGGRVPGRCYGSLLASGCAGVVAGRSAPREVRAGRFLCDTPRRLRDKRGGCGSIGGLCPPLARGPPMLPAVTLPAARYYGTPARPPPARRDGEQCSAASRGVSRELAEMRVLGMVVAAACILLAGCGGNATNTGPFGNGGSPTGECISVPLGGVISYGFVEFPNQGSSTAVISKVALDGAHGIRMLAAYIIPITGHDLYGVYSGYPPVAHRAPGVQWAHRQSADGARIPPRSKADIVNNILLVLKRTAARGTAVGVDVYYTEAGQQYHLRTNSTITLVKSCG